MSNEFPCPLCHSTSSTTSLAVHLRTIHTSAPIHHISTPTLTELNLHPCRTCNTADKIFASHRGLRAHQTRQHPKHRINDNTQLIAKSYPSTSSTIWASALAFLAQRDCSRPPAHQGNFFHSLSSTARGDYYAAYEHTIIWLLAAQSPTQDQRLPDHLSQSSPFWKLLLFFDSLFLYPPQPHEPTNINKALAARLALFRTGQIARLFQSMDDIPLQPPPDEPLTFATDTDPLPFGFIPAHFETAILFIGISNLPI
jgi:hypothetical protein